MPMMTSRPSRTKHHALGEEDGYRRLEKKVVVSSFSCLYCDLVCHANVFSTGRPPDDSHSYYDEPFESYEESPR